MTGLAESWTRDAALRLLCGLHYLVLAGEAAWEDADAAVEEHAEALRRFVAEQPIQTNEVQRSWVLLPLFLHAAGGAETVDVVEIGSSAGLNLIWDRYRYRYENGEWGSAGSRLTLTGAERRPVPAALLRTRLRVRTRVGIDPAPIDATTAEGARLLKSFVWAGQEERLARLDAAVEALRADPPRIVRADVADALPAVLAALPRGGLTLVFQTSVFEYLSERAREVVRESIDGAGRPLVFVASGRPRGERRVWGMRIHRPGREREFAGHADYHGAWLDYEL